MGVTALASSDRVYLDTNVWIYVVEGFPQVAEKLAALLRRVDAGDLFCVTSELTLAEAMVKPLMNNDLKLRDTYEELLRTGGGLTMTPISRSILLDAAKLRAKYTSLKLPDAIHAATALASQCHVLISNDQKFSQVTEMSFMSVADL